MKSCFLNVDLEIESASKLDLLAGELGRRVFVLYSGPASKPKRHLLALECARNVKGPDVAIHALCSAIQRLSPAARRIWNAARKEFNVGYELSASDHCMRFSLQPETLERVANLGATLVVSCYKGEISR